MAFHPILDSAKFIRSMQSHDSRLESFTKFTWEVRQIIDVNSLAASGLFYANLLDKCICSFCLCIIEGFCLGDTAEERHSKANPNCPFLKRHVEDTICISQEEREEAPIRLDMRYEILETQVDCNEYGEGLLSRFTRTVNTISKSQLHHTARRNIHRLGSSCGHWLNSEANRLATFK